MSTVALDHVPAIPFKDVKGKFGAVSPLQIVVGVIENVGLDKVVIVDVSYPIYLTETPN